MSEESLICNFCGKSIACNMTLASRSRPSAYTGNIPPNNKPKVCRLHFKITNNNEVFCVLEMFVGLTVLLMQNTKKHGIHFTNHYFEE